MTAADYHYYHVFVKILHTHTEFNYLSFTLINKRISKVKVHMFSAASIVPEQNPTQPLE